MAAPTEFEYKLLKRFRENIKDLVLEEEQQEDMYLLGWIRARENDLAKAENMLRTSLKWREKEDMGNIFNWNPPASYSTLFHAYFSGTDNDGRPVFYLPLGTWNVRQVVEKGERNTYIRFVDQMIESIVKNARKSKMENGSYHTQFVIILDMKGFPVRQVTSPATVSTFLETFRRFEANFPETLKTAFVINAGRIFPMLFDIVKPLLSLRTRSKVQIFNSDMKVWKAALLNCMDQESLPDPYKGTISSKFSNGNEILRMEKRVDAGGKVHIHFDVRNPNSVLEWEFETVDYDIGFAIFHEEAEVYSYERWDAHRKKAKGSLTCKQSGTYTLMFDNTYSRLRAKTVRYSAMVLDEKI